ncbi:MAG: hypothetical protein POELPBGB_00681 [Bacteroidia bacterium]|nr:hypothetical protein [Bacteroidia bacterium]
MTTETTNNNIQFEHWLSLNYSADQVAQELNNQQMDAATIEQFVKEYKKQRHAKQQFNGFICLGVGAFLGFISCVLSILNPFPEFYYAILFGFTGLAICVIMAGLYFVFE